MVWSRVSLKSDIFPCFLLWCGKAGTCCGPWNTHRICLKSDLLLFHANFILWKYSFKVICLLKSETGRARSMRRRSAIAARMASSSPSTSSSRFFRRRWTNPENPIFWSTDFQGTTKIWPDGTHPLSPKRFLFHQHFMLHPILFALRGFSLITILNRNFLVIEYQRKSCSQNAHEIV